MREIILEPCHAWKCDACGVWVGAHRAACPWCGEPRGTQPVYEAPASEPGGAR